MEAWPTDQIESLRQLTHDMNAGQVDVFVILAGNPVYNALADFQFANGLKCVKHSVHVCQQFNETSEKTTWQIPDRISSKNGAINAHTMAP